MTEKQAYALSTVIGKLPQEAQESFRAVAEEAISLGYLPVLKGKQETYVDFVKSKGKRTILKIDTDPKFPPRLAIKFYAMDKYPPFLKAAVEGYVAELVETGYEARCYGCGRCDGTQGYRVGLRDGGTGFWCGRGVVPLKGFGAEQVEMVKEALRAQDEGF